MGNLGSARPVLQRVARSGQERQPAWRVAGAIGIGAVAGIAAAAGVMFGRKAVTTARIGKGHPLKHRVLDLASGAIQPKYPVNAISTYLNGFHMYADEMGRQVEASHFCIHLRHDLHQCVIFDRNAPDARLFFVLGETSVLCRLADLRRAPVDPDAAVGAFPVSHTTPTAGAAGGRS